MYKYIQPSAQPAINNVEKRINTYHTIYGRNVSFWCQTKQKRKEKKRKKKKKKIGPSGPFHSYGPPRKRMRKKKGWNNATLRSPDEPHERKRKKEKNDGAWGWFWFEKNLGVTYKNKIFQMNFWKIVLVWKKTPKSYDLSEHMMVVEMGWHDFLGGGEGSTRFSSGGGSYVSLL